jgi:rhodanese-related sulfurtransferase
MMTMTTLSPLTPQDVAERLKAGKALLVDIREPDEFARAHTAGALSRPLSQFEAAHLAIKPGQDVIFTCKSGMRTNSNCERLSAAIAGPAYMLKGGLDGWAKAGLPVETIAAAPLEINRQVQITAGVLILIGAAFGWLMHPAFYGLSAFVGAGLTFAGISGTCMMANVLMRAPWNRRAA